MSEGEAPKRGEAGAAGAGAGTGYLGLLSQMPEHLHWLRDTLVFAAPILTVIVGLIWVVVIDYVSRRITSWRLDAAIVSTCRIRDEILADAQSTQADKKNAKDSVAALQKLKLEAINDHVKNITVRLKKITDS